MEPNHKASKIGGCKHGQDVSFAIFTMFAYTNYVAANPKPIERKKESTCLKVFCNEIVDALIFHPEMQDENG